MRLETMFKSMGFTSNWQTRCPGCHRIVNLAELGVRRDAPRGMLKSTFGWCRSCRTVRLFKVEPAPKNAAD